MAKSTPTQRVVLILPNGEQQVLEMQLHGPDDSEDDSCDQSARMDADRPSETPLEVMTLESLFARLQELERRVAQLEMRGMPIVGRF